MANLEYPAINATSLPGQMEQVRRYLYQFAERLSWIVSTLEKNGTSSGIRVEQMNAGSVEVKEVSTFEELKSLIISSADIIQSVASETKRIFDGNGFYVARSDFGDYQEKRRTLLDADSENGVTLLMTEEQRVEVDSQGEEWKYRGCIRLGKITLPADEGEVYGVSVGQVVEHNGTRSYTTSARYKSDGVDFFDDQGRRIAYVATDALGESKLFIEDVEIRGTLTFGGYVVDSNDGIAFVWKE